MWLQLYHFRQTYLVHVSSKLPLEFEGKEHTFLPCISLQVRIVEESKHSCFSFS